MRDLLDLNIYSETFFAEMINMLLKFDLKNMNAIKQNVEGIDLIDHKNKVVAQVSSTNTKQKIESSLKKKIIQLFVKLSTKLFILSFFPRLS